MVRVLILVVVLAPVPAGIAGSVRSVATPGPIVSIAYDAQRVAYAEGASADDCDRVWIWNLQTRGVTKLGRSTPCVQTSTGTGIASLALAGGRAIWLHYGGGNIREWRLFTATVTAPRPRLLRFVSRDVDEAAPIVVGDGHTSRFGDLLPYAVDRTVVALRVDGSRRFAWVAPARVIALSAFEGEVAVATEDATVTILDAGGRVLRTERYEAPLKSVRLTGTGLLVHRGNRLELRDGSGTRNWRISFSAHLEDADATRALYRSPGGEIRSLRFTPYTDRPVVLARFARLDGSTLVSASGRNVRVGPFR